MVLLASTAHAQQQRRAASFPMQRADANGDGKVSWAEVRETAPKLSQDRFNKMDRNGDGLLSREDVPKAENRAGGNMPQGEQLVAILRRADADGDEKVTKQELQAEAPRLARAGFTRLDTNKDGVISEADFAQTEKQGRPTPRAIQRADANGDGLWSYDEIKTVATNLQERVYKSADKDGDGLLNQEELQGLRQRADRERKARKAAYAKARKDSVTKMLESDANEDGQLTYKELAAAKPGYPRENFDRNDRNKDGVISKQDVN
jgi:Ca2+-binding EF-hand superfamily protein